MLRHILLRLIHCVDTQDYSAKKETHNPYYVRSDSHKAHKCNEFHPFIQSFPVHFEMFGMFVPGRITIAAMLRISRHYHAESNSLCWEYFFADMLTVMIRISFSLSHC